jgi:hypothetical protein
MECALTFAKYLGMQEGLDRWAASGRLAPYQRFTVDSYLEATGAAGTDYEPVFIELMDNVFANAGNAMPTQLLPNFINGDAIDQIVNDQKFLLFTEGSQDIDQTLATLKETMDAYLDSGWNQ